MKTFKEWLGTKKESNTNIGDLAKTSAGDKGFPSSYNKGIYEEYFKYQDPDVVRDFNAAFNTYVAEFEKNRENAQITSITLSSDLDALIQSFVEDYRFSNTSSAVEFLIRKGLSE